ncbi:MAG: hypothetical protein LBH05_01595 [Deferribacteraceae bacterium]|nr:hypothetical protein [Deferribacteraceae bacterium]
MHITARKEKKLRVVRPPKKYERQFSELCVYMIDAMTSQYRNNTFKELNKSTVEKWDGSKFHDSQYGNFSTVFLSLSKSVQNKILARFSDEHIRKEVRELFSKMNNYNKTSTYQAISDRIGIDPQVLFANEALSPTFNALIEASVEYTKKLRDDTLQQFTTNSLAMMTQGKTLDDILEAFDLTASKRRNVAEATARQQIACFNNLSTKIRYQNLGITQGIWQTNVDGRQRVSHEQRDGEKFDLDVGCYSTSDGKYIFPGEEWGCRCTFQGVIPDDEVDITSEFTDEFKEEEHSRDEEGKFTEGSNSNISKNISKPATKLKTAINKTVDTVKNPQSLISGGKVKAPKALMVQYSAMKYILNAVKSEEELRKFQNEHAHTFKNGEITDGASPNTCYLPGGDTWRSEKDMMSGYLDTATVVAEQGATLPPIQLQTIHSDRKNLSEDTKSLISYAINNKSNGACYDRKNIVLAAPTKWLAESDYASDWNSSGSKHSTLTHEIGHTIDKDFSFEYDGKQYTTDSMMGLGNSFIKLNVSEAGAYSVRECIAECFSRYIGWKTGKDKKPSDFAIAVAEGAINQRKTE